MGGYGSGRRGWRPVVEDGLKLSVYYFARKGLLKGAGGTLSWNKAATKERVASISYWSNYDGTEVTLKYTKAIGGERHEVEDSIELTTTESNFGGVRYWWVCPGCCRRCAMLYTASGRIYFRCRECYNLTYQSSNDSGKFNGLYRIIARNLRTSPTAVKSALKRRPLL